MVLSRSAGAVLDVDPNSPVAAAYEIGYQAGLAFAIEETARLRAQLVAARRACVMERGNGGRAAMPHRAAHDRHSP